MSWSAIAELDGRGIFTFARTNKMSFKTVLLFCTCPSKELQSLLLMASSAFWAMDFFGGSNNFNWYMGIFLPLFNTPHHMEHFSYLYSLWSDLLHIWSNKTRLFIYLFLKLNNSFCILGNSSSSCYLILGQACAISYKNVMSYWRSSRVFLLSSRSFVDWYVIFLCTFSRFLCGGCMTCIYFFENFIHAYNKMWSSIPFISPIQTSFKIP